MQLSVTRTLLLAAVASVIMLSKPVPVTGSAAAGPAGSGTGRLGVTRFVCAHCTSTGELSHRGMFLNRASVRRHIAASKPCRDARMGIREILLEARAGDVMAAGGALRGPRRTSDISQQVTCRPKSDTLDMYHINTIRVSTLVV